MARPVSSLILQSVWQVLPSRQGQQGQHAAAQGVSLDRPQDQHLTHGRMALALHFAEDSSSRRWCGVALAWRRPEVVPRCSWPLTGAVLVALANDRFQSLAERSVLSLNPGHLCARSSCAMFLTDLQVRAVGEWSLVGGSAKYLHRRVYLLGGAHEAYVLLRERAV